MNGIEIYNSVREVPEEAKKTIKGGRLSGMTDINPQWRIQTLTKTFGLCGIGWYYTVTNKWTETYENEVCAFVDIELYVKQDNEWSKPIHGTGGSKLATSERNGIYVSDECYKMATTDAISVACKQLGFGADVYWAQGRSKYSQDVDEQKTDTRKAEQKKAEPQKADNVAQEKAIEAGNLKLKVLEYIKKVGMSEDSILKICNAYKVKSINDMSPAHCKHYILQLEKRGIAI